jgi:hypothetical protein
VHIQVERAGNLVLGAYDNFHRNCVVASEPTSESFLAELKAWGVIGSYNAADSQALASAAARTKRRR